MTCPSKPTAVIPAKGQAGAADSLAMLVALSHKALPAIGGRPAALHVFRMLQARLLVDTMDFRANI